MTNFLMTPGIAIALLGFIAGFFLGFRWRPFRWKGINTQRGDIPLLLRPLENGARIVIAPSTLSQAQREDVMAALSTAAPWRPPEEPSS